MRRNTVLLCISLQISRLTSYLLFIISLTVSYNSTCCSILWFILSVFAFMLRLKFMLLSFFWRLNAYLWSLLILRPTFFNLIIGMVLIVKTVFRWIKIFWASFANYFESFDLWFIIVNLWTLFNKYLIPSEKLLRKRCTKVSTIKISCCRYSSTRWLTIRSNDGVLVLFHSINFITFWTEHFNSTASEFVTKPDRYAFLIVAQGARASTKDSFNIFV